MKGALLSGIDTHLGGGPRRWSDVIIVRNVGPLHTLSPLAGDNISNRGFNALLCAADGAATHFLKVRPEHHQLFAREAALTVELGRHPAMRSLVPASSTFVAASARILAQEFVAGTALDLFIRKRAAKDWQGVAAQVLRASAPMWESIRATTAVEPQHGARALAGELAADLELLVSIGVSADAAGRLRPRLARAPLPRQPQHGDFWPRNLLVVDDGWRVLDFECCGDVALPLYDVFHFVRGCAEAAGAARPPRGAWVPAMQTSPALLEEFRSAAAGLNAQDVETALVAYHVDFTARLYRRGVSHERVAGRLQELDELPALLDKGAVRALMD